MYLKIKHYDKNKTIRRAVIKSEMIKLEGKEIRKLERKIKKKKRKIKMMSLVKWWNKTRYNILKTTEKTDQQLYANKIENIDEMCKFLKIFQW